MESEKVKKIKKAWRCCGDGAHLRCQKCPYIEKGCEIQLIKDTLALINELESENERLNEYIKGNEQDAKAFVKEYSQSTNQTVEAICKRLEQWGGHGMLYANELRKEYNI